MGVRCYETLYNAYVWQLWIMLMGYGDLVTYQNPKSCKLDYQILLSSTSIPAVCSYKIRIGLDWMQGGQMDRNAPIIK